VPQRNENELHLHAPALAATNTHTALRIGYLSCPRPSAWRALTVRVAVMGYFVLLICNLWFAWRCAKFVWRRAKLLRARRPPTSSRSARRVNEKPNEWCMSLEAEARRVVESEWPELEQWLVDAERKLGPTLGR